MKQRHLFQLPVQSWRSSSIPAMKRRLDAFEVLENRNLLAVTVDTLVDEVDGSIDDGDVSLRDALDVATAGGTIDFDGSLDGGTLLLTLGELTITKALTIDASALARGLTIDASGNDPTPDENSGDGSRVFNIDDGNGNTDSPVTISGLVLTGGDVQGDGGAIRAVESLTVTSSQISGNSSDDSGGGISGRNVTVTSSTVSGNSALGGGGIRAVYDVTVTSSVISGNAARGYGGGIEASGDVTVTSSTVAENSTQVHGGGISAYGDVAIKSSTISGNTATLSGAGIAAYYEGYCEPPACFGPYFGDVTIVNSTITGNSSGGSGGGILGGNLTIENSIVANNSDASFSPDLRSGSGTFSQTHSLIGDNTGTGLTEAHVGSPDANGNLIGDPNGMGTIDPLLGPLSSNGGPTQTHALLPGSPAIDAGDAGFSPPPGVDQRGASFVRVFAGRIDMGAYEAQTQVQGDVDFDGDMDFDDIDPFVLGLKDPEAYEQQYGVPPACNGDTDDDGGFDFDDIPGFVSLLTGGGVATNLPARTDYNELMVGSFAVSPIEADTTIAPTRSVLLVQAAMPQADHVAMLPTAGAPIGGAIIATPRSPPRTTIADQQARLASDRPVCHTDMRLLSEDELATVWAETSDWTGVWSRRM